MKSKKGLFLGIAFLLTVCIMLLVPSKVLAEDAMSAEFKSLLNKEEKLVFNSFKPTTEFEWYGCFEGLFMEAIEGLFIGEYIAEDFTSFDLGIHYGQENEEVHRVEIVYNYDKKIKEQVEKYATAIPEDLEYFYVNDLELFNYWINDKDEVGNLIDYSGELKKYLDYKNFKIDIRCGGNEPFLTQASGIANFMYNGTIYGLRNETGVWANHIIYVPENTGDTKEELISAVQKRIEEIGGKDKIKIEYGGKISEFKKAEIAEFDNRIAEFEEKIKAIDNEITEIKKEIEANIAILQEVWNKLENAQNETNKYMGLRDNATNEEDYVKYNEKYNEWNEKLAEANLEYGNIQNNVNSINEQLNSQIMMKESQKMPYISEKGWVEVSKQSHIDSIENKDGEKYFLNQAAGDNYFTATVGDFVYNFIIIKDSKKMVTPTVKTSDVKTDVTISTLNPSLPLDTTISVNKLTSGEKYEKIIKLLNVANSETFDLTLYSTSLDKNITKLNNGKFQVEIPISEKFDEKTLVVYYVDDKENITEYEVTAKDDYAIFTTDHFSIYTLAEKKEANEEEKTSDENINNNTNTGNTIIDNNLVNNTTNTETSNNVLSNGSNSSNPKTGDNILLFVGLLVISIVGILATINFTKSEKNK